MKHIKNFENFSLLENKQERTIKTYTDSSDSIDFNLYSVKDETDSIKYLGEVWFDGIKYDGYIKRQKKQVEQFKKLENKKIPENIDYDQVKSLRIEAVQKLKEFRPVSIGQASRISGVSPADISVLLVYLGGR